MATDWAADVKKYVAKADDAAIAGIVKYCGIALRNRDSALVSFSDRAETDRVRTNFLKKKLALTQADSVLDAAIAKVAEQMKADRTKNRVTVYYLLASEFKQLGLFSKAAPVAKKAPTTKAPAKAAAAKSAPAKAAPAKAAPAKAAAKSAAAKAKPAAKTKPAAKAAGAAAVVAGAAAAAKPKPAKAAPVKAKAAPAAAKAPAKAKAPNKAKAPAKPAPAKAVSAAPKKAAAATSAKQAAPAKKAASSAKATTAKAAAPASNVTQGLLDKAASTASDAGKAAPKVPSAATAAAAPIAAAAAAAASAPDKPATTMAGGSKPAASSTAPASANAASTPDDGSEMGWLWWVIGLAVLAFLAWFLFARGPDAPDSNGTEAAASAAASDVGTDLAAAPAEGSVTIPVGAGVTSEMRDGKPVVKVYFDTAKTEVSPDFAKTAGGLKSYLDTHSGSAVAISGYNDPSGNAAANAELSKQRAQAVQAGLVAAGIPAEAAMLVKPEVTADATVSAEAARRVEVVVK